MQKTIGFLAAMLVTAPAVGVASEPANSRPATLLAALPPQAQASEKLVFDVLMDGSKIGQHVVTLWDKDDKTFVDIDISLKVGLGPIVFYRYEQRNRALWENGALLSFVSRTDDDGDEFAVQASRDGDALSVAVNGTDGVAVSDWFPTTYWNKRTVVQDRLLATRDGEVLDVDTKFIGVETIEARGERVEAEKFEMRGDLNIDLWYDENDRWVKLAFDYRGNRFDYVLR
ncbi:hypothetical protein EOI86_21270 [Hwanghaeella grinnelliae]|uniref:DUF3108 domain-containing protein n=1 Tax=Hwanghaeella grinnelliae TaxID=2500179 RepID=A0A3S2VK15_9PROT|nr:DUF6134 family protein [Hwanghaeella grinnelliae]RVU33686.1 hypothetical protein EOI86_21270 [Hwanghaeella grinnelliae]